MINHTKWPLDRNETLKLQDDPSATLIPQHFPVSTPIVVDPSARTGIVGEKSTKMVGLSARREHCSRKVELIPPQPDLSFLRSLLHSVRCSFRCSFLLHAFRLRSSRCLPTASLRSYRCLPIANLRSSRCSPATHFSPTAHPPPRTKTRSILQSVPLCTPSDTGRLPVFFFSPRRYNIRDAMPVGCGSNTPVVN